MQVVLLGKITKDNIESLLCNLIGRVNSPAYNIKDLYVKPNKNKNLQVTNILEYFLLKTNEGKIYDGRI